MFTDQMNGDGEYWYFLAPEDQWRDIDTQGTAYFNGEEVTVDGAHELTDVLAESGRLEACWSREYFRFTMGRLDWDSDRASIDALTEELRQGGSLADAFTAAAHLPQFKSLYRPPTIPEVQP